MKNLLNFKKSIIALAVALSCTLGANTALAFDFSFFFNNGKPEIRINDNKKKTYNKKSHRSSSKYYYKLPKRYQSNHALSPVTQIFAYLEEKDSKKWLKKLERATPGSHFYSRHSAATTLSQQKYRARTGITPDGVSRSRTHAFRFFSYADQKFIIEEAIRIHKKTGKKVIDMYFNRPIGEGYLLGGHVYKKSSSSRVIFFSGKIYTSYPLAN